MISGAIKNCDVTVRDIDRSIALWGPALPALKGRTTGHKTPAVPEAPLTMPFRDAQMCCDIMAVDRNLFLISVVKPFQFFMATPIRNKSAEDIHAALTKQLKTLRGHQVIVRMIHSDRESGVKAVVDWMHENGILPELTGAGEAVQAAERGIRLVKERARAVISGLPFVLPRLLVPALVEYCVQRINGLQSSVSSGALSGRSPKEEMTGRVLDAKRDLALGFGDYVQVHAAHVDNSMAERTVGCIALHPTENLSGAWNFLNLNTVAMTVRQSWTSLPTPDFVLDRLNELAATRGQVEVGIEGNASVSLDEQQQGLPAEGAGEEGELEEQSENELPDMLEGDWEESMEDGGIRDPEHAMKSSKASVTPDGEVAVGVAEQRDVPSVTDLPAVMERPDAEHETREGGTLEPKNALQQSPSMDTFVSADRREQRNMTVVSNAQNALEDQIGCTRELNEPRGERPGELRSVAGRTSDKEGIDEPRAQIAGKRTQDNTGDDWERNLRARIMPAPMLHETVGAGHAEQRSAQAPKASLSAPQGAALFKSEGPTSAASRKASRHGPRRSLRPGVQLEVQCPTTDPGTADAVLRGAVIDARLAELETRERQLLRAIRLASIEKRLKEIDAREEELRLEKRLKRKSREAGNDEHAEDDAEATSTKRARAFVVKAVRAGMALNLSVKKAIKKFGSKAMEAIVREVAQLDQRYGYGVVEPVDTKTMTPQERKSIIPSHMFVKEKLDSTGAVEKVKARIVAGGNKQDAVLYPDRSAPTAATDSVLILAAIAAREGRSVGKMDFPGAFLHAPMPADVPDTHMRIDSFLADVLVRLDQKYEQYLRKDGSLVVKLTKALYGTLIAARQWYMKVAGLFEDLGFVVNPYDACVFNRESVSMILHVDDVMLFGKSEAAVKGVMKEVRDKYPGLTCETGVKIDYLGMLFDFRKKGFVTISMQGYVDALIEESGTRGTAKTPAGASLYEVRSDAVGLGAERARRYHTLVCKLLYLAKRIRPDLLTTVAMLVTRTDKPSVDDEMKLSRALKYLNGTRGLHLTLGASDELAVIGAVDASFAVHADCKSVSGTAVTLGRGTIFAKSAKQRLVTRSSTEAELVGASEALGQVLWTANFLKSQGYKVKESVILQDNLSTIAMLQRGRSNSARTRHVNIRYYFVHDYLRRGELRIEHCPSQDLVADILTKPIQGDRFVRLRDKLLGVTE
ncbi:Copia protein [Porphyridium purpureum]|uniref:Copia protein n=1 Tax=Porphyridium purpureum TaxID=35688 RepID=A0A5J4Z4D9_PORPP|nr:Copia protein [Porphyridium purpureum]|eukprot:POR6707..scf295_1